MLTRIKFLENHLVSDASDAPREKPPSHSTYVSPLFVLPIETSISVGNPINLDTSINLITRHTKFKGHLTIKRTIVLVIAAQQGNR